MKKNCYFLAGVCFSVILLCLSCSKTDQDASAPLKVTGPIEVTEESYPFNAADHSTVPQDLAAFNYIEEEYFASGKANVYDYDADGHVVIRTPDASYTTRIHIRRPADKSTFSGNVVVELNNPTAMHDLDLQWMFCILFDFCNFSILQMNIYATINTPKITHILYYFIHTIHILPHISTISFKLRTT